MRTPIKTEKGPEIRLDAADTLKRARYELSRQRVIQVRICGSTMRPAIVEGDLVTVEPVAINQLRVGEIVLANSLSDTALIHRVVRLDQHHGSRFVVTRADASAVLDEPVPASHVLGRVTAVTRDGARIPIPVPREGVFDRMRAFVARLLRRRGSA
jgi:signal peptidase I